MKKIELAYIAGIMDADGFFTISKSTYAIRVTKDSKNPTYSERIGIKQVNSEAIQIIYDNFGGYFRIEKPSTVNGKPLYAVELRNIKANTFLNAIYPYLKIKKKQADILIQLRQSLSEGKKQKIKIMQKDRWGNMREFTKYTVSKKQVEFRESLINQLNQINDIRQYKFSLVKKY